MVFRSRNSEQGLNYNGRQYISKEVYDINKKFNVEHLMTSTYNPSCNGLAERLNYTIGSILRINKGRSLKEIKTII